MTFSERSRSRTSGLTIDEVEVGEHFMFVLRIWRQSVLFCSALQLEIYEGCCCLGSFNNATSNSNRAVCSSLVHGTDLSYSFCLPYLAKNLISSSLILNLKPVCIFINVYAVIVTHVRRKRQIFTGTAALLYYVFQVKTLSQ